MPIITIDGQIGSGAIEVGAEVARKLNIDYVDRLILAEAGKRVGITMAALAEKEQQRYTLRDRLARLFRTALERSAYSGAGGDPFFGMGMDALLLRPYPEESEIISEAQQLDDFHFFQVVSEVVHDLAQGGDVVIVGRGSNIILQDHPDTLHVSTVASMDFRVKMIMAREHGDEAGAQQMADHQETARVAYFQRYFKFHPDDSSLYHITLNPGYLGTIPAAEVVAHAAQGAGLGPIPVPHH